MKRKMWLIIAICILIAACLTLSGRLRTTNPATVTVTETARLSATDIVIVPDTATSTLTPTVNPSPTPSATFTAVPPPTRTTEPTASETSVPPTPSMTPEPGSNESIPQIIYFSSDVSMTNPGETIQLSWQTVDATGVTLYLIPPSHHLPQSGWDLPATGSYTITISPAARNYVEFLLNAYSTTEHRSSQGLTVFLHCPDPWFFTPAPDICPTAPLYSAAAEQKFEHGVMLWIGKQKRIIVLFDDSQFSPKYSIYRDEWEEGHPDRDPSLEPPEGLEQPIRGFGLVWRTHTEVSDRLGWATQGEIGFDTIIQNETRYKYNATYIRAVDGNVWFLGPELSSWKKIVIQQ